MFDSIMLHYGGTIIWAIVAMFTVVMVCNTVEYIARPKDDKCQEDPK